MKIVFWNTNNKDLQKELAILVDEIEPDIVFLAEMDMSITKVLSALNHKQPDFYFNGDPICVKINMFSKFNDKFVRPIKSNTRYTVRNITIPTYPSYNLIIIHYQSKVNWDTHDQAAHSMELNLLINEVEAKYNSQRTVLAGDLNMNPFEFGMVQTTGLHSVMSKDIASKVSRVVNDISYPYFYNPMWSFFGDNGRGDVNGTYYSSLSKPINYFWNILDQVLIRPEMIPFFDEDKLQIISKMGTKCNLLTSNRLINTNISDHLPITFTINPNPNVRD